MLEIFELVLRELLVGRNNLMDLKIRVISSMGEDCLEVSLYVKHIDTTTFWYDTDSLRSDVYFYYRAFELPEYIRLRFLFHEEINS